MYGKGPENGPIIAILREDCIFDKFLWGLIGLWLLLAHNDSLSVLRVACRVVVTKHEARITH